MLTFNLSVMIRGVSRIEPHLSDFFFITVIVTTQKNGAKGILEVFGLSMA